jgi:ribonucleoside-diphosphate reductase alpha chain
LPPQPRSLGAAAAAREVLSPPAAATSAGPGFAERSASEMILEARVKGYEGEACNECGNFTLVRNGTCLKCDTCGGTSGCS